MSSKQIEVPEVNGQDASLADNPLIHNPEKHLSSEARAFLTRPKKLYIGGSLSMPLTEKCLKPKILPLEPELLAFQPLGVKISFVQLAPLGRLLKTVVANQTRYGLAATIWSRDTSKALRLARKFNAGAVWINCAEAFDPNLPWGGFKESGWGRELGQEGVEAFTELKAVTVKL